MNKLKINNLEEGKFYKFINANDIESECIYVIKNSLLYFIQDNYELVSEITYNDIVLGYFKELQIDWSKVPRGTKVQVRDNEKGNWRNAYFSKLIKENEEYSFRASAVKDDEFTNLKMDDNEWGYKYCRIYSSKEILPEWFKKETENKEDEKTINNEITQEEINLESLDTLRDKANDLVEQINSNDNCDFNIISQNLTREEMIKVIKNNLTEYEGFYMCPEDYGLNYRKHICHQDGDCKKCWLYAIKEVKFKDEK